VHCVAGPAQRQSQRGRAVFKGYHRIDANALTLRAPGQARIGPNSDVTVAGPMSIESPVQATDGRVETHNDAMVGAGSLFMQAEKGTVSFWRSPL